MPQVTGATPIHRAYSGKVVRPAIVCSENSADGFESSCFSDLVGHGPQPTGWRFVSDCALAMPTQ